MSFAGGLQDNSTGSTPGKYTVTLRSRYSLDAPAISGLNSSLKICARSFSTFGNIELARMPNIFAFITDRSPAAGAQS